MGSAPCDVLAVELELDRIDGTLALDLRDHMRAFARAHAKGRPSPHAPRIVRLRSTLATAHDACKHDVLADRGLALLRLVAPLAIESEPDVETVRAARPTWARLQQLATARDAATRARFGCRAIELLHRLHGVADRDQPPAAGGAPGVAVEGWRTPDTAVDHRAIVEVWRLIADRAGVSGRLTLERSASAHPRAFVTEPRCEVVIVVPDVVDTPAARFAVLHELGHAVVALALRPGVPRVLDEAAASYVARLMEAPSRLPAPWRSEHAGAARARRLAIAATLDAIERRLPELGDVPSASPPWALWHDPGAQASYVAAETLADQLQATTEHDPARLVRELEAARERIDRQTRPEPGG